MYELEAIEFWGSLLYIVIIAFFVDLDAQDTGLEYLKDSWYFL